MAYISCIFFLLSVIRRNHMVIHRFYKRASILFFCLSTSCVSVSLPPQYSEEHIVKIYDNFIKRCDEWGLKCSEVEPKPSVTLMGSLNSDRVVGVCETIRVLDLVFYRSILIDNSASFYGDEFEVLVYHEMAHCFLDAEHTETDEPRLMRPYTLSHFEISSQGGPDKVLDDFFKEYKLNNLER